MVFEKVIKEYRRRQPGLRRPVSFKAVDSLDLTVYSGELLTITGPSGTGKSTVAQLMVGLKTPTSGSIFFDGEDITGRRSPRRLAGRRQIVFQNPYRSLSPRLIVSQIVLEPARIIGLTVNADALLDAVSLPGEVGTRRPHQLSTGERQRVAIARALSTGPDFIVLDEPTAALDALTAADINSLILSLKTGRAVVLISHDPRMVKAADRAIRMEAAGR